LGLGATIFYSCIHQTCTKVDGMFREIQEQRVQLVCMAIDT
jgi:hypothetical protein